MDCMIHIDILHRLTGIGLHGVPGSVWNDNNPRPVNAYAIVSQVNVARTPVNKVSLVKGIMRPREFVGRTLERDQPHVNVRYEPHGQNLAKRQSGSVLLRVGVCFVEGLEIRLAMRHGW